MCGEAASESGTPSSPPSPPDAEETRSSDGVTRIDSATVIHVAQAVPSSVVGTPLSVTRMRGGRDDLADVVAVIFEQVPVGGRLGGGSC